MTGGLTRRQMAWRIAHDLPEGAYVNLGIGSPEMVAEHLPEDREIILHSENGLLGMGPRPPEDQIDLELVNAGKKPVSIIPGGSYVHHTDSFAMIRGGHIDVCVLGAFQVSAKGDLANWATDDDALIPAVGGAMDLAAGAKSIYVMTDHCTRAGEPKIMAACTYPLTGSGVVDRIYTDLAVIDVTPSGLQVSAIIPDLSFDILQQKTGAPLMLAENSVPLTAPDFS